MNPSSRAKLSCISLMQAAYSAGIFSGIAPPLKHNSITAVLWPDEPEAREQSRATSRINGERIATAIQPMPFLVRSSESSATAALMTAGLGKNHPSLGGSILLL